MKFYIDVFKDGGAFVPENHPDVEAYRRMCEDSGWNFVTSRYHYQIFAAAADESPTPIHTDLQLQQRLVETVLWKREFISILVSFIMLIAVSYWILTSVSYTSLLFFTGVLTLLIPGFGIYLFILATYLFYKMLRAKRKIASGQSMEFPSLKDARRRVRALFIPTGVFLVFLFASIVADAFFAPFNIALVFLPPPEQGVCVNGNSSCGGRFSHYIVFAVFGYPEL
ncbi:MAG: DUF2812 domain-containing protein [Firmicutes bacterium]|nr:DUF2812 domain-containing protein [Bacillota bacterium]